MNASESATDLAPRVDSEAGIVTTRRRPTRAAQARAAAAAQEAAVAPAAPVERPPEPSSDASAEPAPVRRSPRGRPRAAAAEAPVAAAPVAAAPEAAASPVVAPEPEPGSAPRPAREGHGRYERGDRHGREGREAQPREGQHPRDGQHARGAQGFREGREHRHRDPQRDQRQRDQREAGGRDQRHRDPQRDQQQRHRGLREDNRGNRASEREIREMREARELAEALLAEQGIEQGPPPEVDLSLVPQMEMAELYELARQLNIFNYRRLRRQELIQRIRQTQVDQLGALQATGILEIMNEGFGFVRVSEYFPSPDDIYVSQTQIRRYDLWSGDTVTCQVRPPKEGEKYFSLVKLDSVNEQPSEVLLRRIPFENLTPIYPCQRLHLETTGTNLSMRLMDLFNPLGKGQRALIVSPPKAGKTTLLKQVANSISENHPEVHLIALLIDERPEEVTDMQRSIKGEVVASTFDELPENHIRVAELVMEKAKRQVEMGKDVVILLDSITRMARAYNSAMPPSGRTLSGGLDPNAMHKPKRFFGAARKLENSGSLTIIATALIDTGSRMDEVIYEEFKGTGNSELTLDRRLADRRIFPAIDIKRSSTRKDELLLSPEELRKQRILRKTMDAGDTAEVTEFLADRLSRTKSNAEFLMAISDS